MIASIRYITTAPATAVCITMADGQEWHTDATLPPDTGLRALMHEWLAGNDPEPYVAPALTQADYAAAIDAHVEAAAQSRGYKSAANCAGYATSTVPAWAGEAAAFVAWRDAVWLSVFAAQSLAKVSTIDALIASLPAMEWPT